jgi:hypothetical protein
VLRALSIIIATAAIVATGVLGPAAARAAPPGEDDPAGEDPPLLRLELPAVETRVGEEFEARLEVHTREPVGVFAIRIEAAVQAVRLRSWSFGSGIERHIALHGEPPACDVIVYPDGSRLFAVMVMDPPFSSEEYGSEGLVLHFAVESAMPLTACVFYSGDTPDYEPGEDIISVVSRIGAERRCAPVRIAPPPAIRRGDANGDAARSIADPILTLNHLFLGGRAPSCADAADADDDGLVNLTDCVLVLNVLFHGTRPPWGACGADRTADALPACRESSC